MRLIKIAACIVETSSRVRVALAGAHPEAALFASLARSPTGGAVTARACAPQSPDPVNHQRPCDMFQVRDESPHRETAPSASEDRMGFSAVNKMS